MTDTPTGASTGPQAGAQSSAQTDATTPARLAVLGLGNMNGAILAGLLAAGTEPASITATTGSAASARTAAGQHGIEVVSEQEDPEANLRAVAGADVVLLGVKPHGILELCRQIAPALAPPTVVVSVAAGITLGSLQTALPADQPVVRSMPNTPLTVGRGTVGVAAGGSVTEEQLQRATAVFAASGTVHVVDEAQIDAVAALAGSGPAYTFLLAELMAAGGRQLGLDEALSTDLARSTVAGAGAMLADEDVDPAQLRRAVSSPKGTTEAAISTFLDGGLAELIARGMRASADRSAQLGAEFGS